MMQNAPKAAHVKGTREREVVEAHYRRLGKDYNQFLYYSPEFVRALTSQMIKELELVPGDRLVDLGCGTAMYTLDILKQVRLDQPVVGVDPFPEMLRNIPADAPIVPLAMDALAFSRKAETYDKILVKEAVHHVSEREELFRNLYQRLSPGGILLLVHVPPKVRYPLFDRALKRCEGWHADPNELTVQLQAAGFRVQRSALDYPHAIPKEVYFKMVAGQYMSVLTSFSDEEMKQGLQEMAERYRGESVLHFVDHFDYLKAVR